MTVDIELNEAMPALNDPAASASFAVGDPVDLQTLYRKIAPRIVPLAVVGCMIAQIDRANVAFAKLQFLEPV